MTSGRRGALGVRAHPRTGVRGYGGAMGWSGGVLPEVGFVAEVEVVVGAEGEEAGVVVAEGGDLLGGGVDLDQFFLDGGVDLAVGVEDQVCVAPDVFVLVFDGEEVV